MILAPEEFPKIQERFETAGTKAVDLFERLKPGGNLQRPPSGQLLETFAAVLVSASDVPPLVEDALRMRTAILQVLEYLGNWAQENNETAPTSESVQASIETILAILKYETEGGL